MPSCSRSLTTLCRKIRGAFSKSTQQSFLPTCAVLVFVVFYFPPQNALAQASPKTPQITIDSLLVSGTRNIDSAELAEIVDTMAGSTFDDESDEVQERILSAFQDRGYFQAEVKNLDIHNKDPLASPKTVQITVIVNEGARFRLSDVDFQGNVALSSRKLRAILPLKTGDIFAKNKIAGSFDGIRKLYSDHGYLDLSLLPDAIPDSGSTAELKLDFKEGVQYRLDKLEILGPPEVAEKLQLQWHLAPGAVFNRSYLETFFSKNSSLLPVDFTQSSNIVLIKNCPQARVSVHLHLISDSRHEALDRSNQIPCPKDD